MKTTKETLDALGTDALAVLDNFGRLARTENAGEILAGLVADAEQARESLSGAWQPIESAPRDGSRILVFWPYLTSTPCVAKYCGSFGGWDSDRCANPVHEGAFPERNPTHWMPLPEPPQALEGQ